MYSVPYIDPISLWLLPPHEFNEWRAANDLPQLFAFFVAKLPAFQEWLNVHELDIPLLCRVTPSGELFVGDQPKFLIEQESDDKKHKVVICSSQGINETVEYWKIRNKETTVLGRFEPYFAWAKRTLGRNRFFFANEANKQSSDTIIFNSWMAFDTPQFSRATMLSDFQVLKLGGVELHHGQVIGPRNLDFADLDHLNILGTWHGSYQTNISFSSCQHWRVINAELNFIRFYRCPLEDFCCEKSRLQDIYFESSSLGNCSFSDTYAFRLTFDKSSVIPDLTHCELRQLKYVPDIKHSHSQVVETYRRFRAAFQERGWRHEASEAYYNEQIFERKAHFSPYLAHREQFPPMGYAGRLIDIIEHWERGTFSGKDSLLYAFRLAVFHVLKWVHPKYVANTIKFKAKWLASFIDWAIWGYGERPVRIFGNSLAVVAGYSAIYHAQIQSLKPPTTDVLTYWDCLYFSMITFSTLGYGDILPTTPIMKLICGSEAIIGAFTMGLVVAGFANRNRY
jgi:uncharacterized protein YjbI with pentapeptide repeats